MEEILRKIKVEPTALVLPDEAKGWWVEQIIEDLEILRDQLKAAIEHQAKFHLSFMY